MSLWLEHWTLRFHGQTHDLILLHSHVERPESRLSSLILSNSPPLAHWYAHPHPCPSVLVFYSGPRRHWFLGWKIAIEMVALGLLSLWNSGTPPLSPGTNSYERAWWYVNYEPTLVAWCCSRNFHLQSGPEWEEIKNSVCYLLSPCFSSIFNVLNFLWIILL